jgi:hypothetical protein
MHCSIPRNVTCGLDMTKIHKVCKMDKYTTAFNQNYIQLYTKEGKVAGGGIIRVQNQALSSPAGI